MKKFLFVLIIIFSGLFLSSNQSYAQFGMKVGPSVGLNLNVASGDLTQDTYTGLGILLGGQIDMSFTPVIGLITNVNFYDNKSVSNSVTENNVTTDDAISLGYFEIQPLFKLSVPNSGFYFFAGPGVGFNIEATEKVTQTVGNNAPQTGKGTLKNLGTRFELKAGSGMNIHLSSLVDLAPEFSFAYGLTDVFSTGNSWKVMSFNLSAVIKFNVL